MFVSNIAVNQKLLPIQCSWSAQYKLTKNCTHKFANLTLDQEVFIFCDKKRFDLNKEQKKTLYMLRNIKLS